MASSVVCAYSNRPGPKIIGSVPAAPSGNRIVYDSIVPYNPTPGVPDYYSRGLFVINADGTGRRALPVTGALQNACRAFWSPDGTWLAFSTTRYYPQEIYIVRADGRDLTRLTDTKTFDSSKGDISGMSKTNTSPSWGQG